MQGLEVELMPTTFDEWPAGHALTEHVLELTAKTFRQNREIRHHFIMLAKAPRECIVMARPRTLGESYAQTAWVAPAIREVARQHAARAIFTVSEVWQSKDTKYSADSGSEPRLDPSRRELVMVLVENPGLLPPMEFWSADIERKGRPRLTPWRKGDYKRMGGRLYQLLPPEAYGRGGIA